MARPANKPPYVYRVTRRNKRKPTAIYWYSAPPGLPRVPVPYPYMSPEFLEFCLDRNRKAFMARTSAPPGTFEDLADIYMGNDDRRIAPSQQWLDLKERTQKDYRGYAKKIVSRFGQFLVVEMDEEIVVALRDSLRSTPRVANYMINVLSAMLAVALEHRSRFGLSRNVAANVKRLGTKAGVKPRNAYWSYEDEARFLREADKTDPIIALGERLLAYTGQRPSDVRAMRLSSYDGERIKVVQSKTGARVWIPCHKSLKPHLDQNIAEAKAQSIEQGTFIRGLRGKPIGERYFASRWDAISSRTGTAHLNRQDLRRTAVVRLAEAGCEVPQIAAITGHSLRQVETMLETYFVRTYPMAKQAIAKLESYQDGLKRGQD